MYTDVIAIIVISLIIILVSIYIIKAKKKGQKCIGCPYSKTCKRNCCNSNNDES